MDKCISICIPTYNGEKYLADCLSSVCKQNTPGISIEIIVSDDCSTDNTLEIVKTFQQKDARIRYYTNTQNIGLVENWKKCLDIATGEWIKFVFQDDILKQDCILRMAKKTDNAVQIIACDRDFIFEEGVDETTRHFYLYEALRLNRILPIKQTTYISANEISRIAVKYMTSNFIGEPTSVMFRRSIMQKVGFFNKDLIQIGDIEYWLRIATQYGLLFIPDKLTEFRVHKAATTHLNITRKYYQAIYLDKIIISSEFLYNPVYAAFRKNLDWLQLRKVKFYFLVKLYAATLVKPDTDDTILYSKEFKNIIEKYPAIQKALNQSWIEKAIFQLALWARSKYLLLTHK